MDTRRGRFSLGLLVVVLLGALLPVLPAGAEAFADPAFERVWERTDRPIASGEVSRTWTWGPEGFRTVREPYQESPGGSRQVQYFDKSRMEITNPNGDRSSRWFATNGLLVKELISGRMQVGDNAYETRPAAAVPVAGDPAPANPGAPTYASLARVATLGGENRAPNRMGQAVTATLDGAGNAGDNPGLAGRAAMAYYEPTLGHNIPNVFWSWMNAEGFIYQEGQLVSGQVVDWLFAMGYPLTEPYWARVRVGGVEKDVLLQAYERRVLTYDPSNPEGWQVEMGNVGRHYHTWRYETSPAPAPTATPTPGTAPGPSPTADPCSYVPASTNGSITPRCGAKGTAFVFVARGFTPGEKISFWLTEPGGAVFGAQQTVTASATGTVSAGLPGDLTGVMWSGVWALTFQGLSSSKQAIVYFGINP